MMTRMVGLDAFTPFEDSENTTEKEEKSYGLIMMERLTGSEDRRIDHVLQDKTFRHPYISAIGAHTNYWRDPDTALFILKHLYRDVPEEPPELHSEQLGGCSKDKNGLKGWSDPTEVADEELPLMFDDGAFRKLFFHEIKKGAKK